nr:glycosyltransferase [Algibacter lectus]
MKQDWVVDIYGNGETTYIEQLKSIIKTSNLEEQINIKAPVFGAHKLKVFRDASLFVLPPTFSENFGIVIAEALASYTPVITTKGTPWEGLQTYNCGQWIDIGVEPLAKSLTNLMTKRPETLMEMGGVNGRRLIEKKYSMQAVAKDMLTLYNWILNKTEKPTFIDTL